MAGKQAQLVQKIGEWKVFLSGESYEEHKVLLKEYL
jgi:hypothetical protein